MCGLSLLTAAPAIFSTPIALQVLAVSAIQGKLQISSFPLLFNAPFFRWTGPDCSLNPTGMGWSVSKFIPKFPMKSLPKAPIGTHPRLFFTEAERPVSSQFRKPFAFLKFYRNYWPESETIRWQTWPLIPFCQLSIDQF